MSRTGRRRRRTKQRVNLSNQWLPTPAAVAPGSSSTAACQVMGFGHGQCFEQKLTNPRDILKLRGQAPLLWINIDGLSNPEFIVELGQILDLHPLAIEDVINQNQLAKCEDYGATLFFVSRMLNPGTRLESEQLCLFLGIDFVISIQEYPGDCFDPIREKIRKHPSRLLASRSDLLAHALIDAIIDSYFPIVDRLADQLDQVEDRIGSHATRPLMSELHGVKNDLLLARRAIRPLRDAVNQLIRDPSPLIQNETKLFIRDCYDHCQQLIDLLETYRELCADLRDYHLSMVSLRMNEIMKVLTVIATIFMPLSFIASLYGMNFDTQHPWNMPELNWPLGYLFVWCLMLLVTLGFLTFFYRKGWIFNRDHPHADDLK